MEKKTLLDSGVSCWGCWAWWDEESCSDVNGGGVAWPNWEAEEVCEKLLEDEDEEDEEDTGNGEETDV